MLQRRYETLARVHVEKVINNTSGKFFTAVFEKKDGSTRAMTARLGVTSYLQGGENKVAKPSNSYKTVYDVQAKGYRTLNLGTLQELRANGVTYKVVD